MNKILLSGVGIVCLIALLMLVRCSFWATSASEAQQTVAPASAQDRPPADLRGSTDRGSSDDLVATPEPPTNPTAARTELPDEVAPWLPKDWTPNRVQADFLKSMDLYERGADQYDPIRADSLAVLLRRHRVNPELTQEEKVELQRRIQPSQEEIVECSKMLRAARNDCHREALRRGDYESFPRKWPGPSAPMAQAAYLKELRERLGAPREEDFDYTVLYQREKGNTILYLVRARGYEHFFALRDQLADLEARQKALIRGFLETRAR